MPTICYTLKNFGNAALLKIDLCNDIINEYAAQGFDLTLRQLYYQLVSRGHIANNIREYKNLGNLVNDARLAGYIDWERIIDRTRNLQRLSTWATPAEIISSAAGSFRQDLWSNQAYRPEVWIEKNALVGVIAPICERLRVPYFACVGYTSQSEMWSASQRLLRYIYAGQQPVILHLGDHDPSGIDMSRDIQDRLKLFIEYDFIVERWWPEWWSDGIEFERLALNIDQVHTYRPPPNPAKLTDSRASGYVLEHGYESWELDALDPTTISALIEDAVEGYRDDLLWDEAQEAEDVGRKLLKKASSQWETELVPLLSSS